MDTIGDFLTIIRNASSAGRETCSAPWSKMRQNIAYILKNMGFIKGYEQVKDEKGHASILISLKYVEDGTPVITAINRKSTPGCRIYCACDEIPRVLGGLGISILSTSSGVMDDGSARRKGIGGELICQVW